MADVHVKTLEFEYYVFLQRTESLTLIYQSLVIFSVPTIYAGLLIVVMLLCLQFVAHPHCQQLLASIWYEGIPGWRKRSFVAKVLIIISLIMIMPLMAVYYLILPRSRLGQIIRTPFMKFMYHR